MKCWHTHILPPPQQNVWPELKEFGVSLTDVLCAAKSIYGSGFNPQISLKALSYYDDGDLRSLPDELKNRLIKAVAEVDLSRL